MGRWILLLVVLLAAAPSAGLADATHNRLGAEASPYLQLHATDPVHWRSWSAETLAEAAKSGKPILLSIGYLACHWCHVMQRESYEDPETAALINRLFTPVLIDREQRPDLDSQFQSAALVLNLPTGWPLTLFLMPDGRPFWGGTYFPKEPIGGMAPFRDILKLVDEAYRKDRDALEKDAQAVIRGVARLSRARPGTLSLAKVSIAARTFAAMADPFQGGFGETNKFPYTVALEVLWREHLRGGGTPRGAIVKTALDSMVTGGLYDHVGGGFYRYTVDPAWQVPHFEKMLDVNASLLRLAAEVWREAPTAALENAVRGTVAFLLDEMRMQGGAFASALDADSRTHGGGEEEEGAFYTWTRQDIASLLGPQTDAFFKIFALAPLEDGGEGEPGNLYTRDGTPSLGDTAPAALNALLGKLKKHRAKRPRPRRDNKVLSDWNGMVITALTEAGLAFGEAAWIGAAAAAFNFITGNLQSPDGKLSHAWAVGVQSGPATVEGLAWMAGAALTLMEATGRKDYLAAARRWVRQALDFHWDKETGGFYASASNAGPVVVRSKPVFDEPNASGNAMIVEAMARLYYLTGDADLAAYADRTLNAFGGMAAEPVLGVSGLLNAAATRLAALQIVIIGQRGDAGTDALLRTVAATSLPARILQVVAPGTVLPETHPAQFKEQVDGLPTAYVCKGAVCSLPVTETADLQDTLVSMRRDS